ncbi:AMP-dependent synthetase/ligase [Acidipropionibacterium timonense]|uniref:AMP-dependent synthetase/ligase n=1 Tax=Acidipropionibacterium timonense TaxID=2161818 RepID=UPI00102FE94E|nr:long-chain fatty acid--CoA ligase [Acidipropionibacterium timonense]
MTSDTLEVRERLLASMARNVGDMLRRRVDLTPEGLAYLYPQRLASGPENWTRLTWAQAQDRAHDLAAGLLDLGVGAEERVAICADTCIEWILMDFGIQCAGAATTTVYANTQPEDVEYILTRSQSVVYVAQNSAQAVKILGRPTLDEQIRRIILVDDDRLPQGSPDSPRRLVADDDRVLAFSELEERGQARRRRDPGCVQRAIDATGPETLSTLIFTSGTTGDPKGVELPHRVWTYMGVAMESWDPLEPGDLQYLWLPLAHVFGKCLLAVGLTIGYSIAVDGRVDRILTGMQEVRPTFMCGVPRIFEKVRSSVRNTKGLKGGLSRWAFDVGRRAALLELDGARVPVALAAQRALADRLVLSRLRAAMGGRVRMMISGSAKLSPMVQEWFLGAGVPVVEGYGSTETTAIAFFNVPKTPRFGTVGKACPGMETMIADDGELLLRGPTVARCYHDDPERTARTWTQDGWYHTGDVGSFDEEGNLTITERKRDLIKTSNGKYIAPQKVEAALTANGPMISHAVVAGEGHKYAVALITLDSSALAVWAGNHGHADLSHAQLTELPEVREMVQRWVDRANAHLGRWETIKRFAILDHDFDGSQGMVTENLKVRRDAVIRQYKDVIESLYDVED